MNHTNKNDSTGHNLLQTKRKFVREVHNILTFSILHIHPAGAENRGRGDGLKHSDAAVFDILRL